MLKLRSLIHIKNIKFFSYQKNFSTTIYSSFKLNQRYRSILDDSIPPDESKFIDLIEDKSLNTINDLTKHDEKDKKVFVLQLKMQYKSKPRQSTTAELQLSESVSLVHTLANWKVVDSYIVGTKHSYSSEIFGEGNQEKLSKMITSSGANVLFVVIDRLTNLQIENLKKTLVGNNPNIKIFDRYNLVLEIFKRNARTKLAKLQIALAEIPYIRHKFDNATLYKNIEKKLKKEIKENAKNREVINANRTQKTAPLVSVFGYTNSGKTSLIKCLTNDPKLKPENKLFATLDVTYHGINTGLSNSSQNIIIADTIGFISDIPYSLIEAFKTTLYDAIDASVYIHVIDLSHPNHVAQTETVYQILQKMAPKDKLDSMLTVYNKCDLINPLYLEKHKSLNNTFFVSCKSSFGLNDLMCAIEKSAYEKIGYIQLSLKLRQGSNEYSHIFKNAVVKELKEFSGHSDYVIAKCLIDKVNALKFIKLYPNVKVVK